MQYDTNIKEENAWPLLQKNMLNNFKGVKSHEICTYVFLVSIDRCEVPTPYGAFRLLLKFRFRVEFFDFRVSA
jgi:hypothetical protein